MFCPPLAERLTTARDRQVRAAAFDHAMAPRGAARWGAHRSPSLH
ncbi:hypothetical protein ACFYM5_19280 [Streptomyces sp. NPDC006706]